MITVMLDPIRTLNLASSLSFVPWVGLSGKEKNDK
ncbi:hypothetical protein CLNEO_10330 [Anaerotignum neopropionicum]|uniref:Uncharacterized protein n=1 Tax=Anaerotignum neopropionicum TaxID=36847 RepID=A0A136WH58_9FIRM|nr:hypothetical protein CLNEO_10330 [Anaerotignum neopropionicum]